MSAALDRPLPARGLARRAAPRFAHACRPADAHACSRVARIDGPLRGAAAVLSGRRCVCHVYHRASARRHRRRRRAARSRAGARPARTRCITTPARDQVVSLRTGASRAAQEICARRERHARMAAAGERSCSTARDARIATRVQLDARRALHRLGDRLPRAARARASRSTQGDCASTSSCGDGRVDRSHALDRLRRAARVAVCSAGCGCGHRGARRALGLAAHRSGAARCWRRLPRVATSSADRARCSRDERTSRVLAGRWRAGAARARRRRRDAVRSLFISRRGNAAAAHAGRAAVPPRIWAT